MSEEDEISSKRAKGPLDVSRRALLIGAGSTAALLGLGALRYAGHNPLVRPPGGQDEARLVSACIRCEKCYEACPRGVIVPAHIEDGLLGMRSPALKFDADFCDYCADENGGEPLCVKVCPTEASHVAEDGSIQIDKEKCIGCQFCVMACPYGVRYLNEEEKVVEKCTLCEQKLSQGELPQCVSQCGGNARWIGDTEAGYESFEGSEDPLGKRRKMVEFLEPFTDADVHKLPDVGNKPSYSYILRDHHWEGGDE